MVAVLRLRGRRRLEGRRAGAQMGLALVCGLAPHGRLEDLHVFSLVVALPVVLWVLPRSRSVRLVRSCDRSTFYVITQKI